MSLFRIKICGVARPEDAAAIAAAGADAIGLNFYASSSRFVDDARAAEIIAAAGPSLVKVGVFVNASADEIREKVERLGLDWVQLHGDELPQFVADLQGIRVIRAMRWGESSTKYLAALTPPGLPTALLLDAYSATAYGGTGQTINWAAVPEVRKRSAGLPLILAGGLTPENVAEAIHAAQPDAIDTASGVESSPGVKDPAKIRAFIAAARTAFR